MTTQHLRISALAGTGKTTTCCWGLGGVIPSGVTLSDEQDAIVTAMQASKSKRVKMMAYNKDAATEIEDKVPGYVDASTFHSAGRAALVDNGYSKKIDKWKTGKLLEQHFGITFKKDRELLSAISKIADLVRDLGKGEWDGTEYTVDAEDLQFIGSRYNVDVNAAMWDTIANVVPGLLTQCIETADKFIDFADMTWLPVVLDLVDKQYDMVVVDEAQDMNMIRRKMAFAMGERVVFIGDENQAIYGFTGAERDSMDGFTSDLTGGGDTVQQLKLTMTRRCGKAIVAEAQKIVPEYRAHPDNHQGAFNVVSMRQWESKLTELASESNMILCRNNAPLVGFAYGCIKNGIPAYIKGRDIGYQLSAFVKKLGGNSIDELQANLDEYQTSEMQRLLKKKWGSQEAIEALDDKCECVTLMAEGKKTADEVSQGFTQMFQESGKGLRLSSAHKSKGLEADYVSILRPDLLPHPSIMDKDTNHQEINLQYVGYTRAIKELNLLTP